MILCPEFFSYNHIISSNAISNHAGGVWSLLHSIIHKRSNNGFFIRNILFNPLYPINLFLQSRTLALNSLFRILAISINTLRRQNFLMSQFLLLFIKFLPLSINASILSFEFIKLIRQIIASSLVSFCVAAFLNPVIQTTEKEDCKDDQKRYTYVYTNNT